MKKVIMRIPEIDYVLVHWEENRCTPWVAAWAYNEERNSWGQGHYFQTKESAVKYLVATYKERYSVKNRINEILSA